MSDLFLKPVKIPARAEGPALGGKDDEVALRVALQAVEHEGELGVHRLIHTVHRMVGGNIGRQHTALPLEGETLPFFCRYVILRAHVSSGLVLAPP